MNHCTNLSFPPGNGDQQNMFLSRAPNLRDVIRQTKTQKGMWRTTNQDHQMPVTTPTSCELQSVVADAVLSLDFENFS